MRNYFITVSRQCIINNIAEKVTHHFVKDLKTHVKWRQMPPMTIEFSSHHGVNVKIEEAYAGEHQWAEEAVSPPVPSL